MQKAPTNKFLDQQTPILTLVLSAKSPKLPWEAQNKFIPSHFLALLAARTRVCVSKRLLLSQNRAQKSCIIDMVP